MKQLLMATLCLFLLSCSNHTIEPPGEIINETPVDNPSDDPVEDPVEDPVDDPITEDPSTDTLTDIDGNTYQIVQIGNQWWMAENLKATHYRNGDAIPGASGNAWTSLSTGAYCAETNASNANTYGYLYNWYAVNDSRNIAPAGWHVPTDDDWKTLEIYLGLSQSVADMANCRGEGIGGKLKETGTSHWATPNEGATNASNFTALPAGRCSLTGSIDEQGNFAFFWSASAIDTESAWSRGISSASSYICRYESIKQLGYSVRLVRD